MSGSLWRLLSLIEDDRGMTAFSGAGMDVLIEELKGKLITLLNLQELTPETFDADAHLVGGELGIDSIDVLEMVVMVEKDYGVLINNQEVGQQVFATLRSLAAHIKQHSPTKTP